jgi:hypothetical protein
MRRMEPPETVVDRFHSLYSVVDATRRRELATATLSDGFEFYGLQARTSGRPGMVAEFRGSGILRRTTAAERRSSWIRWGYELVGDDGALVLTDDGVPYAGTALGRVDDSGRFTLIVPFLGDVPPPRSDG